MPRLVYSLHFETEREPGAPIIEFVVPLDRVGNSPNFWPMGKPLVVDLRPGDCFLHREAQRQFNLTGCSHPQSV